MIARRRWSVAGAPEISRLGYVSDDGAKVHAGVQDRRAAPRRYIDDRFSELAGVPRAFRALAMASLRSAPF
jgi:hypothetical protein